MLIILAVIVLPMLLSGRSDRLGTESQQIELPPKPEELSFETRRFPVGVPDKPLPDASSQAPDQTSPVLEGNNDESGEIGNDQTLKVINNQDIEIGTDQTVDVGSNVEYKAGQKIHIDAGTEIVMEAGMSITLKVGGSTIKVDNTGVTIEGTMINIKGNAMTEVSGSAMLTLKGGLTKIN